MSSGEHKLCGGQKCKAGSFGVPRSCVNSAASNHTHTHTCDPAAVSHL